MWDRARLQLAALPGAGHLPGVFPAVYEREEKIRLFSLLLSRALEWAADPSIGLVLLHLPGPHPPSIYSPSEGAAGCRGYLGRCLIDPAAIPAAIARIEGDTP